jgi:alkaline phosphatase
MGITTLTAARIFQGQQRGADGERNRLAWEALPWLAL